VALALHGLACLLARRYRRAIYCFGLEVIGVLVMALAVVAREDLANYEELSDAFKWMPRAFTTGGLSLFVGSYLIDVGTVLYTVLLRGDVHRARVRAEALGVRLMDNPLALPLFARAFAAQDPSQAQLLLRLIVQHPGDEPLRQLLTKLLSNGNSRVQNRVRRALVQRGDPGSLAFLEELPRSRKLRERLLHRLACFVLRIALFPRWLLISIALALPSLVGCLVLLIAIHANAPEQLFAAATTEPTFYSRALTGTAEEAITKLGRLARSDREWLANMSVVELRKLLAPESALDEKLTRQVLEQVEKAGGAVQKMTRGVNELEKSVIERLEHWDLRDNAQSALLAIDTPSVVRLLIEHVQEVPKSATEHPELLEGARHAIDLLGLLKSEDLERMRALDAWQSDTAFPLHERAQKVFNSAPLRARSALLLDRILQVEAAQTQPVKNAQQIYDELIRMTEQARGTEPKLAATILAKVHGHRGRMALGFLSGAELPNDTTRDEAWKFAGQELWAGLTALDTHEVDVEALDELFALGMDIAHHWHDSEQPDIEESYRILTRLEPLAQRFNPDWQLIAAANLAEATLTQGQFAEAERRASEALKMRTSRQFRCVTIAMLFLRVVAAALQNDENAMTKHEATLRTEASSDRQSTCTWQFNGVRRFLADRVGKTGSTSLLELLDELESGAIKRVVP
jgi:hypothetical protein